MGHIERIGAPASPRFRPSVTPGPGYPSGSIVIDLWRAQFWGASEAMSAIRVPRTRRENTVEQWDATLPGGDLDPGPGRTWTRTC